MFKEGSEEDDECNKALQICNGDKGPTGKQVVAIEVMKMVAKDIRRNAKCTQRSFVDVASLVVKINKRAEEYDIQASGTDSNAKTLESQMTKLLDNGASIEANVLYVRP